jgi:anti-anti-sigma factor
VSDLARLSVAEHGDVVGLHLSGEVDLSNAVPLEQQLLDASTGARGFFLDLSDLSFLDSSGLRLIDRLAHAAARRAQAMRVACPSDAVVRRALDIAGVATFVPLDEDETTSLRALRHI